jgi:hypothetical protein
MKKGKGLEVLKDKQIKWTGKEYRKKGRKDGTRKR